MHYFSNKSLKIARQPFHFGGPKLRDLEIVFFQTYYDKIEL